MQSPFYKLYRLVEHLRADDSMETEMRFVAEASKGNILTLVAGIMPEERQHHLVMAPGQVHAKRANRWFNDETSQSDAEFSF